MRVAPPPAGLLAHALGAQFMAMLRVCAATGLPLTRPLGLRSRFTARASCLHGVGEMVAVQAGGRQHRCPPARAPAARAPASPSRAPPSSHTGLHAQQPQCLCFEQAPGGAWSPPTTATRPTVGALPSGVGARAISCSRVLAGRPGLGRGYARRIKTIQVAARGVGVGVLDGVAAARWAGAARPHPQQGGQSLVGANVA